MGREGDLLVSTQDFQTSYEESVFFDAVARTGNPGLRALEEGKFVRMPLGDIKAVWFAARDFFSEPAGDAQSEESNATSMMRTDSELRNIAVHINIGYYKQAYNFLTEASTPQEQERHISALHASGGVVTKAREILDFLNGKD